VSRMARDSVCRISRLPDWDVDSFQKKIYWDVEIDFSFGDKTPHVLRGDWLCKARHVLSRDPFFRSCKDWPFPNKMSVTLQYFAAVVFSAQLCCLSRCDSSLLQCCCLATVSAEQSEANFSDLFSCVKKFVKNVTFECTDTNYKDST
jgi:hypothetical protein